MQQQSFRESQGQLNTLGKEVVILKSGQEALIQRLIGPFKQAENLGIKIDSHSALLKMPLIQKVVHEHHVPKLLYATVALFCICICLGIGWFRTGQRLDQFRNNDTRWRKLLLVAKPALTKIMQDIATAVDDDPVKAREAVEKEENHNVQVWDLHQKMVADTAQMKILQEDKKKFK